MSTTVGIPQLVRTFAPGTPVDDAEPARVIEAGVGLFLAGYDKAPGWHG
ncbi:hypothetical protein [Kitasatospora sp. NPDC058190]